jgi:hypothetical protein
VSGGSGTPGPTVPNGSNGSLQQQRKSGETQRATSAGLAAAIDRNSERKKIVSNVWEVGERRNAKQLKVQGKGKQWRERKH